MRLRISCKNYKAFRDRADLEVRPLTVLFGRNSSGKSALLGLLRLCLEWLSSRCPPGLPLTVGDWTAGGEPVDLIHARTPHGEASIELEAEIAGREMAFEASLLAFETWLPGGREQALLVSRFRSAAQGIALDLSGYEHGVSKYGTSGPVQFRGLLPDDRRWPSLSEWRAAVDGLASRLVHLGAVRAPVDRSYSLPQSPAPNGHRGERAPFMLATDTELCDEVGAWIERELGGWRVRCDVAGEHFGLVARRGAVTVNLAETGQGLQQVLPVVVQQIARQREASTQPFLDLIEQPELHLHTGGQAPLADLVLQTARLGRGAVVVETHSENFLLRLQRRIAEGLLPADDVAVYWLGDQPDGSSRLARVELNSQGETEGWPAGVFAEAYEEVKALRRAQRPRGT